jgi:hypothetical protein
VTGRRAYVEARTERGAGDRELNVIDTNVYVDVSLRVAER